MSTILSSAVSSVGKAVRSVANSVRELNTGTFSGAVDVIVVREKTPDGYVYRSTPFHVKFGMLQIMSSSERFVSIEINGEKVPIRMKLASSGFAYFSLGEDWDDESALSNISADESISMENVKKQSSRLGMIRSGSFSGLNLSLGRSGGISRCRSYPYFDKENEDTSTLNKPQINVCEQFSTGTTDFYQFLILNVFRIKCFKYFS